jgi:hypothetical protein
MASRSESERQRYSQDLVAYTLRQFSAASISLERHKAAAAKLPAIHQQHLEMLARAGWVSFTIFTFWSYAESVGGLQSGDKPTSLVESNR